MNPKIQIDQRVQPVCIEQRGPSRQSLPKAGEREYSSGEPLRAVIRQVVGVVGENIEFGTVHLPNPAAKELARAQVQESSGKCR